MSSSVADVYGAIGAARMFTGAVSTTLGETGDIENEIKSVDEEIDNLKAARSAAAETNDTKAVNRLNNRLEERENQLFKLKTKKVCQSSTDFLGKLCNWLDIGKEELSKWIANTLVGVLPFVESSVKALLLTNIKKMVSCSLDPMIPSYMRESGVTISEYEVDPRGILRYSPLLEVGENFYFGTDASTEQASLVRANDMNAFMWFVKHKTKLPYPTALTKSEENWKSELQEYFKDCNFFGDEREYKNGIENNVILPGSTFRMNGASRTLFMCARRNYVFEDLPPATYNVVPVSENLNSLNWYKHPIKKKNWLNDKKERPIFNLQYAAKGLNGQGALRNSFIFKILPKPYTISGAFISQLENYAADIVSVSEKWTTNYITKEIGGKALSGDTTNLAGFQIAGVQSFLPKKALFDANGYNDSAVRCYSVDDNIFNITTNSYKTENDEIVIISNSICLKTQPNTIICYLNFDCKNNIFWLSTEPDKVGEDSMPSPFKCSQVLTECYAGDTIYEFNYDYIMSLKLFDENVIARNIVNGLLNVDWYEKKKKDKSTSSDALTNTSQAIIDNQVNTMVQKLIDSEDGEFNDCFYSFSNEDYEKLEAETNQRALNGSKFGMDSDSENAISEVYNILDAYDADATYNDKTTVISRAISQAFDAASTTGTTSSSSNTGDSSSEDSQSYDSFDDTSSEELSELITRAIKLLSTQIVYSVLTPKVLMLIQVNKTLMNNDPTKVNKNYDIGIKSVLESLQFIIVPIIKQVLEMIQKELLKVILERIRLIFTKYLAAVGVEVGKKWVELLKNLLSCLKFNRSNVKSASSSSLESDPYSLLNSTIDLVDTADIDDLSESTINKIMPTNNCW